LKLFINKNTRFIDLYIPQHFDHQMHLISGAEHCFSELEYLRCNANIDVDILEGLSKISQSIKRLKLRFDAENSGIIELIEAQKKPK